MRLIGLTGMKRSGKDTLADWLVAEKGFVKYSLASPIKQMLLDLNPFLDGQISLAAVIDRCEGDWGRAKRDRIHGAEISYLVNQFSGVTLQNAFPDDSFDELAVHEMLYQLNPRLAGTTELADVASTVNDLEDVKGHRKWGPETRYLMQMLGTEVMRQMYGENVWVDHLAKRIGHQDVVVTDIRFDNEAHWVNEVGGHLYAVQRAGLRASFGSEHQSEAGVKSEYVTAVINNNGVDLSEFRHESMTTIFGE